MTDIICDCGRRFDSLRGLWTHSRSCDVFSEETVEIILLNELKSLKKDVGRVPRKEDMKEMGEFGESSYRRRFGSWNNALEEAGFELNSENNIAEQRLIDELIRLEEELGRVPHAKDMNEKGKFSDVVYHDRFGSWSDALKVAGFEANNEKNIAEQRLIDELIRLEEEIDSVPRQKDMNERGRFCVTTYQNNFGNWNDALKAAGFEVNNENNIAEQRLIDELIRLEEEIDSVPRQKDMNERGEFSASSYKRMFGCWNDALKTAGFEPVVEYPIESVWSDDIEDYYGESWPDKRLECLKRDDYQCRVCESEDRLNVHHIKPRRLFENPDDSNTLDNLITLCPSCHGRFEARWMDLNHEEFAKRATGRFK